MASRRHQPHQPHNSNKLDHNTNSDPDHIQQLKYMFETLPHARQGLFTPPGRSTILNELYKSFWGSHQQLFLPPNASLLPGELLSDGQARTKWLAEQSGTTHSCTHIFKKGECCFRCKDCALDDSCIMCAKCFYATDHSGHIVSFCISQQPGGSCDCGDPEVWKIPINCSYHPPTPTQPPSSTSDASSVPSRASAWAKITAPQEIKDSMSRTIAAALDYALDTLDLSPEEMALPATLESLFRPNEPAEGWAIALWGDEKHSYDEVIAHLKDMTGCTHRQASAVVFRADEEGRDVIEVAGDARRLFETAHKISAIDLTVTMRRALEVFREHAAAVVIEWLFDVMQVHIGGQGQILQELVAAELFAPRKPDKPLHPDILAAYPEAENGTRLDWLFLYHPRLWKRPRLNLKQIYVTILTLSHEHRLTVAVRYANVFHRVVDAYLLIDREAETSIKFFTLELFTVPSVAAAMVRDQDIHRRLLLLIAAFFTNQISDRRIVQPPLDTGPMDIEAYPFRSKRYMPIFSDIRYLCSNSSVQTIICSNSSYMTEFAHVCSLFVGIQPNKRATGSHVEYESDSWINVFNVALSLSRVVKAYGEAYGRCSPQALIDSIQLVMGQIVGICSLAIDRLDRDQYDVIRFHHVELDGVQYMTIDFNVLSSWVSFHNSLHWLLAELLKHVHLMGPEAMMATRYETLRDAVESQFPQPSFLTIIEFPLRVLALVAQVRAGLWVRNGFPIRGQLVHYRDFMLRDVCYDQDLYLLQTALVLHEPDTIFVSMLDRFQLTRWMVGDTTHPDCDTVQLAALVEELLYALIYLVGDVTNALHLPLEQVCKREIVHVLAAGPVMFSDICKRVPERLIEEAVFEHALLEVANFKPSESTHDNGVYELKEEMFDLLEPFFYHYNRAKREEVETIIKARVAKKTGVKDPVLVPNRYNIIEGPFALLQDVFLSPILLRVMFYSLQNLVGSAPMSEGAVSLDAIREQALQLVMIGLVQLGPKFATLAMEHQFENQKTLIELLCDIEARDDMNSFKPKIEWCLEQFTTHIPSLADVRKVSVKRTGDFDSTEKKKAAAKARQAAMMAQFASAQKQFLEGLDEDEDDEEMETGEEEEELEPCILCQEKLDGTKPFGAIGVIHPSRLIRLTPAPTMQHWANVTSAPLSLDRGEKEEYSKDDTAEDMKENFGAYPKQASRFGTYGSTCGHQMHYHCFQAYTEATRTRHKSQPQRHQPECLERGEFVCPLCKSLANLLFPLVKPSSKPSRVLPLSEWLRALGIELLRSTPDRQLERHQFPTGSGEFMFWAAEDIAWPTDPSAFVAGDEIPNTVRSASRMISKQSRHLRDRREPSIGERGMGIYLPEGLCAYTLCTIEVAARGIGKPGETVINRVPESSMQCIRGLVATLTRMSELQFRSRQDNGRTSMRLAIAKRILPEWTREEQYQHPLLLRDPLALVFECAATCPEYMPQITTVLFYVALVRAMFSLVTLLMATPHQQPSPLRTTQHEALFGNVAVFLRSAARHSPAFERASERILQLYGEGRIEQILYAHTLPILRCFLILTHAVAPWAVSEQHPNPSDHEYARIMSMLNIPLPADLPKHEAIQVLLSGWCAHFGSFHTLAPNDCTVTVDYPDVYHLARLPRVLDALWKFSEDALICHRCKTVPQDPAICLICGTTCCHQSHCCRGNDLRQRGECNIHTRECSGPVGIYFLVKRCVVLYLWADSGSFISPPYLDAHGELDIGLRRGRRQYLQPIRMEDIRKTWLTNSIPSAVARRIEVQSDAGGWESL